MLNSKQLIWTFGLSHSKKKTAAESRQRSVLACQLAGALPISSCFRRSDGGPARRLRTGDETRSSCRGFKGEKKINREDDEVADDSQRFFPLARGYRPVMFRQRCHPWLEAINHSVWSSESLLTRVWKRRIFPLLSSQSWDEGNI